jgi:hypothetical protein
VRSSGPQLSLSPATPKLAPRPWDPIWVSTTDAVALLFLPPVLSLVHPALYLPALIFVLLTPARNSGSLLAAPPSLSSPRRQQRQQSAQRRSHKETVGPPSPRRCCPCRPGQGGVGGRAQNTAPCCSWDCAANQSGPPHGCFLVVVIIVGGSAGGGARGGGCRARRQRRKK